MRKSVAYFAAAFMAFITLACHGQQSSPYQVKAAFLYNFMKFVDWPQNKTSNNAPYVVGVLGKDPFGSVLDDTMRGKTVNGHPVIVRRVDERSAPECHVLFISGSERRRFKQICKQLQTSPVLTVGETEGFSEAGGIVTFIVEQNKVRFRINIESARKAGLKIHSTLLNLAKVAPNQPS